MYIKRKAKVNISPAMYETIVDNIEHTPLIQRSTLVAAGLLSVIVVLLGMLLWYVRLHPAKLVRSHGTVTAINSGKTDTQGTITTFITFGFTPSGGQARSVKAPVTNGHTYAVGDPLTIGYSPLNPNYARNLSHIKPPRSSLLLWAVPPVLAFWFGLVALVRWHDRQEEIYAAAEAANIQATE